MGHPKYKITQGKILLDNEDITSLETFEKARKGIFLAFQNPIEISGVKLSTLLIAEYSRMHSSTAQPQMIIKQIKEVSKSVGVNDSLLNRGIFDGFSGGEKKRTEILQMLLIKPKIAILDEPDSGVDVDGLKAISDAILKLKSESNTGFLIITHYRRILEHLNADKVHILYNGKIVRSGGMELAKLVDEKGYEGALKQFL